TPTYLSSLLPQRIGDVRPTSRNKDNFFIMKTRTETYRSSFVPSSVRLWNSTNSNYRTLEHISKSMKKKSEYILTFGSRINNIKHAQLQLQCSKLNSHLFALHVMESPSCLCGNNLEDNVHFLLQCPLFHTCRAKMLQTARNVIGDQTLVNVEILLHSLKDVDYKINERIFEAVHQFISESNRL
ncbi:MAG: hypothetical protein GY702_28655, partial [Desulfobulbaceae bacterium]|nr:hypothetical protein [Desulfobulbaceae bacterium]